MKHSEFAIGTEFHVGEGRPNAGDCRVTDVEARTILAVRLGAVDPGPDYWGGQRPIPYEKAVVCGYFEGPPYRVDEVPFREEDFPHCFQGVPSHEATSGGGYGSTLTGTWKALPQDADQLSSFVLDLREDLLKHGHKDEWENPTLERFLQAFSAVLIDHQGRILPVGKEPALSYEALAGLLLTAKIYE